jgi:hypothetical protein
MNWHPIFNVPCSLTATKSSEPIMANIREIFRLFVKGAQA